MDPNTSLDALAKMAMDALTGHNWLALSALLLVGAVELARKFLGAKIPFLQSKRGGVAIVLLISAAGGLATSALAGTPISLSLLIHILSVAVAAAGGRTLLLSLIFGQSAADIEAKAKADGQKAAEAVKAPNIIDIVNKP